MLKFSSVSDYESTRQGLILNLCINVMRIKIEVLWSRKSEGRSMQSGNRERDWTAEGQGASK